MLQTNDIYCTIKCQNYFSAQKLSVKFKKHIDTSAKSTLISGSVAPGIAQDF